MNTRIVKALIHTPEPLDDAAVDAVAGRLSAGGRVTGVDRSASAPHFLWVAYDAASISATQLLAEMQGSGYRGRLVGM